MGLLSALVGLPIVAARASTATAGQPPKALIIVSFLALGLGCALLAGVVARLTPRCRLACPRDWRATFAWMAVACAAPLLFIGGLVTSTNSGMAVPDWPTTYGSNMFLYPLGSETSASIFLEHSHRLFGTLIGMATLVLGFWTVAKERRPGVIVLAVAALLLVVIQGVLGGVRVRLGNVDPNRDLRLYAVLHGILAQLTVGTLVALAVTLTRTFTRARDESAGGFSLPRARLLRIAATGTLHATILQLILGALYRHLRHGHVLMTHIALSLAVVALAMLAGIAAISTQGAAPLATALRRCGRWMLGIVLLQFTLGWAAYLLGTSAGDANNPAQAVVRTAHQTNGALLLSFSIATLLLAKLALRLSLPQPAAMA
jgi:cytochrome c oxidase assembly protein subunit 15